MLNKRAKELLNSLTAQDLMGYINRPDSEKHPVELTIEKYDREMHETLAGKKYKESLILTIEFLKLWENNVEDSETSSFFWGILAIIRTYFNADFCKLDIRFRPVAALFHIKNHSQKHNKQSLSLYRFCLEQLLNTDKPLFNEEVTDSILKKYKQVLNEEKTPWVYNRTLGIY